MAIFPSNGIHSYESDSNSNDVKLNGEDIELLTLEFYVEIIYFKFYYQKDTLVSQQSLPHCTKKCPHCINSIC